MKTILVFATNNQHKVQEVSAMLGAEYELRTLKQIGCEEDIPETADTMEGNALIKARWVKQKYGFDCFADDSGLEVVALNNAPGVYSARYAGESKDSNANMDKLLANLQGKSDRSARFRTVIALVKDGKEYLMDGVVKGQILKEKAGDEGFGYDPIFQPEGYDETFAQMPASEKNAISHRARAVAKLVEKLQELK